MRGDYRVNAHPTAIVQIWTRNGPPMTLGRHVQCGADERRFRHRPLQVQPPANLCSLADARARWSLSILKREG